MKTALTALALIISINVAHAEGFPSVEGQQVTDTLAKEHMHALQWNGTLPEFFSIGDPIEDMNKFVNSFQYQSETDDHWDTPKEFFANKGGDCEDFASVKYNYMRKAGFEDIKIAVGRFKDTHEDHAVLVYQEKYVLDSRTNKILAWRKYRQNFRVFYYVTDKQETLSDN